LKKSHISFVIIFLEHKNSYAACPEKESVITVLSINSVRQIKKIFLNFSIKGIRSGLNAYTGNLLFFRKTDAH